jgi:MFS-type transporter involved in bile tolerance (Atg22 family)
MGHLIRRIARKRLFIKVCNLFTIFLLILLFWHPYNKTDWTFVSKVLGLVLHDNAFDQAMGEVQRKFAELYKFYTQNPCFSST